MASLIPRLIKELKADLSLLNLPDNSKTDESLKISVIIPAKDESSTIEAVAKAILDSSYRNIELIMVDDRSVDNTFELMEKVKQSDDRVKIASLKDLPNNWTGKTHALHHGVSMATGDLFLFTDADAFFSHDIIERGLNHLRVSRVDVLSLLPGFKDSGFLEKAIYPHLGLGLSYFYPMSEVNDPGIPESALASGCFIMVSKQAYDRLGGWRRFRSEITEDIAFSKAAKLAGMDISVKLAGPRLTTKPFSSLHELKGFWVRTFYGGLNKSLSSALTLLVNYGSLSVICGLFIAYLIKSTISVPDTLEQYVIIASGLAVLGIIGSTCVFLNKYNGAPYYGVFGAAGVVIGAWIAFEVVKDILLGNGILWRGARYK